MVAMRRIGHQISVGEAIIVEIRVGKLLLIDLYLVQL